MDLCVCSFLFVCECVCVFVCVMSRLLQGVGRPDEVLDCVEAGVDLFESFFPYQATERGCALCFDFNIEPDPERAGTRTPTGVLRSPITLPVI